jgi:hypothetical protein
MNSLKIASSTLVRLRFFDIDSFKEELLSKADPKTIYIDQKEKGEIFSATDARSLQKIAIKKTSLTSENAKYLTNEIFIMKNTSHPNIVSFLDSHLIGDQVWVF